MDGYEPDPLVNFVRLQSLTRIGPPALRVALNNTHFGEHNSPGVSSPTAFQESGSDRHRGCLSRLCCVFRLPRPLDALFRPKPRQSCFIPATLMGLALQRFVPSGRWKCLSAFLPLLASLSTAARSDRPSPLPLRVTARCWPAPKSVRAILAQGHGGCRSRLQGFALVPKVRSPVGGG